MDTPNDLRTVYVPELEWPANLLTHAVATRVLPGRVKTRRHWISGKGKDHPPWSDVPFPAVSCVIVQYSRECSIALAQEVPKRTVKVEPVDKSTRPGTLQYFVWKVNIALQKTGHLTSDIPTSLHSCIS